MQKSKPKIDVVTIAIIVILIAYIIVIYAKNNKPKITEAEKITEKILDEGTSFANGGIVDENKLKEIQNTNYDDYKKSLNAKNDFCIYIEDGNGSIILSKGSSKLNRDGIICKE